MRVLKLPWLSHRAENKTLECYALDVNKDGTKLASGGLDGKVKVWDLQSIRTHEESALSSDSNTDSLSRRMHEPSNTLSRPLASMSRHNGVVTSVKFSPDGRFLASGSDDKIVLIWEKDDESAPQRKQFGEAEPDLEHWTVRKRLVAHDNDVQDICWSPEGSLLITVGLDRSIVIWNGGTFERIKRYDIHQSMVKGVVFDPANKFFATASDDRSVRVFRYYKKLNDIAAASYEFQMEQVILEPFKKSPLTSYFRRMSWSPDGQHIAVPNATNGPVTSVAIINRGTWASDVSLIGHEAPCEVCAFSPRLFRSPSNPDSHASILASGGQDRTLAIWSTALPKPLAVLHDLTRKSITDIAWAPDGLSLFVSSLDGSITYVTFAASELGDLVPEDAIGSSLGKYGGDRDSSVLVESVDQLLLERLAKNLGPDRGLMQMGQMGQMGSNRPATPDLSKATPAYSSFSPASSNTLDALNPPGIPGFANGSNSLPSPHSASRSATSTSKSLASNKSTNSDVKASPLLSNMASAATSPKKPKRRAQTVVVTKSGRKRVAPTLINTYSGSSGSSGIPISSRASSLNAQSASKSFQACSKLSLTPYNLPKAGLQTAVHGLRQAHDVGAGNKEEDADADNDNEDMGFDDPNSGSLQTLSAAGIRMKMKKFRKSHMQRKYPTPFKKIANVPGILFSNQTLMNSELSKLVQTDQTRVYETELVNTSSLDSIDESVVFRVIVNSTKHRFLPGHAVLQFKAQLQVEKEGNSSKDGDTRDHLHELPAESRAIIEVRNGPAWPEDDEMLNTDPVQRTDFQDPTQVIVTLSEAMPHRSYVLYFPFRIQHAIPILLDHALAYYVLISLEGCVQIIRAETGSFFFPSFELGANVVASRQRDNYFMVLTSLGQLFCWKFPSPTGGGSRFEKVLSGISVAPAVNAETHIPREQEGKNDGKGVPVTTVLVDNVSDLEIDGRDGMPIIVMERTSSVYTFSTNLMAWTKALDPWYLLAYEKQEIIELAIPGLTRQLFRSVVGLHSEHIERGSAISYKFEESNAELKTCMRRRFEELTAL